MKVTYVLETMRTGLPEPQVQYASLSSARQAAELAAKAYVEAQGGMPEGYYAWSWVVDRDRIWELLLEPNNFMTMPRLYYFRITRFVWWDEGEKPGEATE